MERAYGSGGERRIHRPSSSEKGGKERLTHREVVGMVGETGDDRGGRISPVTGDEEEDAAVSVVDSGSIPCTV
jgi:hypothetical protein